MKKIVVGQAGGPTSVINASLAGFIEEVMDENKLTFLQNGYEGLVYGNFLDGTAEIERWIIENKHVPGACLGSGRFSLESEHIVQCVAQLKKMQADALVVIGGNGTMEALSKIEQEAANVHYDLQVIGIPKTVDNDLGATDHAPGFGSAARYVAQSTLDVSRDLYSMRNFEQVRILETMGRNAGWLALASGFLRRHKEDGPHLILIPERPVKKEELLKEVDQIIQKYGYAVIIVSEGVQWEGAGQVEKEVIDGRTILGGISSEMELLLKKELKIMARAELLGMNQRSSSMFVSPVDYQEAYQAGVCGGKWLKEGKNKIMVSLQRTKQFDYNINKIPVDLKEVVQEGERMVPDYFIDNKQAYYNWLAPLIGADLPSYPSPIPRRDSHVKEPF
ncbi:diphosphate--fructose-6-phosphate 1-phosphotransferase [Oceanobacillus sp. CFH 90083]|uniref:diphosphate--fructose-6-phosphate 1-phosphotransferase n=1 Tax=Oceanobacillus sp. CFH 90083 TaxID=2592336 RepID=UPI00128C55B8|nr:diphosphate--fructose-6-phosphate 1-phosphotransferase [Oceanobacillus sp. CFH 90083]